MSTTTDTRSPSEATVEGTGAEGECTGRLIIFLAPGHVDADVADLATEVASIDGVEAVRAVGRDETYQEFEELFGDSPEVVDSLDPASLPLSVRVQAEGESYAVAVATTYRRDPRVANVSLAADFLGLAEVPDGFCDDQFPA